MIKPRQYLFHLIFYVLEDLRFILRKWAAAILGKPDKSGLECGINLAGYLNTESGIGEAARSLADVTKGTSLPVALNNIEQKWLRSEDKAMEKDFSTENPYSVNILHVNADMVPHVANRLGPDWFRGRYNIGYWYWELENFPKKWLRSFSYFNEIWVASDHCAEAIAKISPIKVRKFPPTLRPITPEGKGRKEFGIPENSFVFLNIFDFSSSYERKNPIALIHAFRKAFTDKDSDAVLVLKCVNKESSKSYYDEMAEEISDEPRILILSGYMDRQDICDLMSVSDCYASLHRAEGLGIPLAEAMTLGKPVIATSYSGNLEFMNENNSFLVKYKKVSIKENHGPYLKGNVWAEPDPDHAAELMRKVYGDRKLAAETGKRGKEHIATKFSAESLATALEARIKDICGI